MKSQYRQGDVLIVYIARLPRNLQSVPRQRGRFVLAEGESTGHCHAIEDAMAELFEEKDGKMYLRVEAESGVELVHEEHQTLLLPRGVYHVIRQVEYAPEAIRRVSD